MATVAAKMKSVTASAAAAVPDEAVAKNLTARSPSRCRHHVNLLRWPSVDGKRILIFAGGSPQRPRQRIHWRCGKQQ